MFCSCDLFENNLISPYYLLLISCDYLSHKASSHPAFYNIAQNNIFVIFSGNALQLVTKPATKKLLTITNHITLKVNCRSTVNLCL